MLLAACGSGGANSDDDGTGTGERAGARSADAGGGTLVVVGSGAVPSLDKEAALVPAQQEVLVNAYEPLLRFAPTELATFQLVPVGDPASFVSGLCAEWFLDQAGFSCTLRDQVSSFGNEVTSRDVAWTFESILRTEGTGRDLATVVGIDPAEPVTVQDEKRFRINTSSAPSSFLLPALTLSVFAPYDSTEAQAHATGDDPHARVWLASNTAGFGPYQVTSFTPAEIQLEANPNYRPNDAAAVIAPAISNVVYRLVPNDDERVALLEAGAAHLARSIDLGLAARLGDSEDVSILRFPYNAQLGLFFDTTAAPFTSPDFRRAISCGVDVSGVVGPIYRGDSVVAHTVLTPAVFGGIADETADICRERDPNRAAALLRAADADADPGLVLHYSSAIVGPDTPAYVETIVRSLGELGIDIEPIDEPDPILFQQAALAGDYSMFLTVIDSHVPDAGYHLAKWFGPDSPFNLSRFATEEQRELLEAISATPVGEPSRTNQLHAYQRILMQDAAVRPFVHLLNDYAIHRSLCGLRGDPGDLVYWQYLTFDCQS